MKNCTITDNQNVISEFQKTLSETVVLLMKMRTKEGISKVMQWEIDETVDTLQEMTVKIQEFLINKKQLRKRVFDIVKKVFDICQHGN